MTLTVALSVSAIRTRSSFASDYRTLLTTWLPVAIDRLHARIVLASHSGLGTFAEDLVRRDRQVGPEPCLLRGLQYQPGVFDKYVERALDVYRAVAQHTAGPIVQHEGVCRPRSEERRVGK